ncbi:unnamed protein product [Hermetia illucens]|uniref:Tyrosine-protein kinase RYK n=1 Tax=Hermetia illucens TaxID=343691 RepID=A0A7R8UCI2_HERIL|nr:unnamed protein product [Hermetia illucens]
MEKFWLYFWGTLVTWCPYLSVGYLNVFINHKEVMKLMGLEAELFYVREGAINEYALPFIVPVPADIYELEFSWQVLTRDPLPYDISISYDTKKHALLPPELSIPPKGFVPLTVESFTIRLLCTGNESEQVPIIIHMHIQGPPRTNDTKLDFRRNKICLKGVYPARNQSPAPAQAPSQGPALLGAAACAMGLVLVVGLIASAMYVRARKQIRQDSLHTSFTTAAYGSHQNVFIRLDPLGRPPSVNSGSYATIASLNKFPLTESKKSWFKSSPTPSPYATALLPMGDQIAETIYSKPESICPSRISYYASSQLTQVYSNSTPKSYHSNSNEAKDKLRRIPCVQSGALKHEHLIREGTYGRIYSGFLGENCDVLIKTVVDGASLTQVACLLSDASMLIGVSHLNILAPMVANAELPGPPAIAYPNPAKGNLKIYLQKSKETSSPLSTRLLVEFGLHVARGLAHLHSLGILHKDIATRNCFLDADSYVRICDSALSRDLFPDDYHCLGDNECRPIKWMALETLQKKYYSPTSDIWSLGVLFWELATLAAMPFEEVDPFELGPYLRDGYRLGQPVNCPDEL